MRDWICGALMVAALAAAQPTTALAAPDFASVKPTPRTEHWQRRQAEIDA